MRNIISTIHYDNKQLFPQAFMSNQRKIGGGDAFDYPVQQAQSGKNTSAVNNFINYENDNFFETDDDRMIVTKKI